MSKIVLGLDLGLAIGGSIGYYFGNELGCIAGSLIGGAAGAYLATRDGGSIDPQDRKFVTGAITKIGCFGFAYLNLSLHLRTRCAITHGVSCNVASVAHVVFLVLMGIALLNICSNIVENCQHRLIHSQE